VLRLLGEMRQLPVVDADHAHDPGAGRAGPRQRLLDAEDVGRVRLEAAPIGRLEHLEEAGFLEVGDGLGIDPAGLFGGPGAFAEAGLELASPADQFGALDRTGLVGDGDVHCCLPSRNQGCGRDEGNARRFAPALRRGPSNSMVMETESSHLDATGTMAAAATNRRPVPLARRASHGTAREAASGTDHASRVFVGSPRSKLNTYVHSCQFRIH